MVRTTTGSRAGLVAGADSAQNSQPRHEWQVEIEQHEGGRTGSDPPLGINFSTASAPSDEMTTSFSDVVLAERSEGQLDVVGVVLLTDEPTIEGLLAFSRIGRLNVEFDPTDCNEVVSRVLIALGPTIVQTHAVVHVGQLPTLVAQPTQLAQVFQNLIANALKFVPEGVSPVVTIAAEPPEPPDSTVWRFRFTDNGIGIDVKDRERIFEMFQRLHTDAEYPGTGIGLALVRKIVEGHGRRYPHRGHHRHVHDLHNLGVAADRPAEA